MNDKEFVHAVDNVLFYTDSVGGGSVLFHKDDLARYLKALPKRRWEAPRADDDHAAEVFHPVEELKYKFGKSRNVYASEHTSLGMVRIGWGLSTKRSWVVYMPEGEQMTVAEYAKRLDDFLAKHEPLWNPVFLHPTDLGRYIGGWGQQRLSNRPAGNRDKSIQGVLKFGNEERNLHAADWVTLGTVVLGYQYSQTTHTIYMWSVPPVPGSRFDRDVDL